MDGWIGLCVRAHAVHAWMDGWMDGEGEERERRERERERERRIMRETKEEEIEAKEKEAKMPGGKHASQTKL